MTNEDGSKRVDHENVQRSRLRVDARKWVSSKLAPKKYGDKIVSEISGPDGAPIQVQQDLTQLTDHELALLCRLQAKMAPTQEKADELERAADELERDYPQPRGYEQTPEEKNALARLYVERQRQGMK